MLQLSDSKGIFWLAALLDAQRVSALIGYSTGKGQGFKRLFGDLLPCVKEVSDTAATILIYLWKKKRGHHKKGKDSGNKGPFKSSCPDDPNTKSIHC